MMNLVAEIIQPLIVESHFVFLLPQVLHLLHQVLLQVLAHRHHLLRVLQVHLVQVENLLLHPVLLLPVLLQAQALALVQVVHLLVRVHRQAVLVVNLLPQALVVLHHQVLVHPRHHLVHHHLLLPHQAVVLVVNLLRQVLVPQVVHLPLVAHQVHQAVLHLVLLLLVVVSFAQVVRFNVSLVLSLFVNLTDSHCSAVAQWHPVNKIQLLELTF